MRCHHGMFPLAVILLASFVNLGCCLVVQLFKEQGFSGLLNKKTVDVADEKTCIQLDKFYAIKSIKTDRCLMIYQEPSCRDFRTSNPFVTQGSGGGTGKTAWYSVRVPKDTDRFGDEDIYAWNQNHTSISDPTARGVQSFHICSQELGGGAKLDVDLFDAFLYINKDSLKSWRGVCKCETVEIPTVNKEGDTISIYNHGNSMYIYSEENCRGTSTLIPAGDNDITRNFDVKGKPLRSFRPADTSDCLILEASIYKFSFFNGTDMIPKTEDVQLATMQTLINYGALPMSQVLTFSDSIGNTMEYTEAEGFTTANSVGVKAGVATESTVGVPLLGETTLKTSLEANYQYTNTKTGSTTNKTSTTETKTISIASTINVASCEKCEVSGFVKIVQNFPLKYTAESTLHGTTDDEKLTAEELRPFIPAGMTYIKDYDEHNVVVSVEGQMTAKFAWQTFVSKNCEPIVNCGPYLTAPSKPTHKIIKVPFTLEDKV